MTTMKTLVAAALVAAALPAFAGPADALDGTWACRTAGVDHGNTPPILFLGAAQGNDAVIDVDGFSRAVFGIGDLASDAAGWWKVTPPQGPAFLVRPDGADRGGRATMQVRFNGAEWRCHRVQPRTT